ncbi:hypothetical protein OIV83_004740 [Microbotryomycetes sp. JL201]|nr:hypothetical protein OIV83_004740 [Microbotryomycetes sp. JL201]
MFLDASVAESQRREHDSDYSAREFDRVQSSRYGEHLLFNEPSASEDAYWARWVAQNERNMLFREGTGMNLRYSSAESSQPRPRAPRGASTILDAQFSDEQGSVVERHSELISSPDSVPGNDEVAYEAVGQACHSAAAMDPEGDSALQSPPLPRQLRTRSAAQLKPFTLEQAKYTRSLMRNGWAGAVVSLPRQQEATTDQLRERAKAVARRPQNDLDGWLELDMGRKPLSDDGEVINDPAAALDLAQTSLRTSAVVQRRDRTRTKAARATRNLISDESDSDTQVISLPSIVPGDHRRSSRGAARRRRRTATPSYWRSVTDREPETVIVPELGRPHGPRKTATTDTISDVQTDRSDASSSDDDDATDAREVVTVRLLGKRKRALGRMMPAVFMKKAQADLRLMAAERDENGSSESQSSSDDDQLARGSAPEQFQARTYVDGKRIGARGRTCTFADNSVETEMDVRGSTEPETQRSGDAVPNWLEHHAPKRQAHRTGDMIDRLLTCGTKTRREQHRHGPRMTRRAPLKEKSKNAQENLRDHDRLGPANLEKVSTASDPALTLRPDVELADRLHQSELWSKFGKFSPSFGICRLSAGLKFAQTTFIGRGHLFALLTSIDTSSHEPFPPLLVADFWLKEDSTLDEIENALPVWIDFVLKQQAALPSSPTHDEVDKLLHHLALYATQNRHVLRANGHRAQNFERLLLAEMTRLGRQLEFLHKRVSNSGTPLSDRHLLTLWRIVDIKARIVARGSNAIESMELLSEICADLVHHLIDRGMQDTMLAVQKFADNADRLSDGLDCTPAAVWVGLVSLALSDVGRRVKWQEAELWRAVSRGTLSSCREQGPFGVVAHELVAFTALSLCALSQFTPSGVTRSVPRLTGDWTVITNALQATEKTITDVDMTISNTAAARRDRFLWNLLARCLVLVEQWSWQPDERGDLLIRLFEVLRKRRFENLSFEPRADFAPFLQQPETFADVGELQMRDDTALVIFLKLVRRTAARMLAQPGGQKVLTRLFMRLSPMTSGSWRSTSTMADDCSSILVNHYSLFLCFALIHRETAGQRLDQARRLLVFDDATDAERKTAVRAALYFIKAYHHLDLELHPVVDWAASFAVRLRSEYHDMQRQFKLDADRRGSVRGQSAPVESLWQRVVLFAMIVRSMSMALQARIAADQTKLDICLLHKEWTSRLFASSLALDPIVATEALNLIEVYLNAQAGSKPSLSRPSEIQPNLSQDDFDSQGFDFDDPSLNQMLGVSDLKGQDDAFTQFVNVDLAPTLLQFASNVIASQEQGAVLSVGHEKSFARKVMQTWARLVQFLVDRRKADWSLYLRYGNQSWRRIIDPLARREVGQLLALEIVVRDRQALEAHQDDLLDIWFQTIVARKISYQHKLTEALLEANGERPSRPMQAFLHAVKTVHDRRDGSVIHLTEAWIAKNRLLVLEAVFAESSRVLSSADVRNGTSPNVRAAVLNMHRSMLTAMKDQLSLYALNLPASAIRAKVRQEFERNALVDDLEAADILLHKGYQELQEVGDGQLLEDGELPPQPDNFLDAFYSSRDDPRTVRPTA